MMSSPDYLVRDASCATRPPLYYPRHTPPAAQMSRGNMRVAKPRSANNSPRDGMMAVGRRQSVMNESSHAAHRRLALIEEQARLGMAMSSNMSTTTPNTARPPRTRPTSWHPSSSHLTPPTYAYLAYAPPTQPYYHPASMFMTSPSSVVHSTHQSPASCSSYYDVDTLDPPLFPSGPSSQISYAHGLPAMTSVPMAPSTLPAPTHITESILGAHYDWNHFVSQGFNTDPPTPNSLIPQHAAPKLAPEESYETLVEESSGPTLVGLGLYDDPPKALSPAVDPYQTMMTPTLLGSLCRPAQPVRQGLKLEETWTPPSDGEDTGS